MKIENLKNYMDNPYYFLLWLDQKRIINLNDFKFLNYLYEQRMNKKMDLKNPKTFNEKLQWLKLYDRKNIYTIMVDKYEVKKYVEKLIGEEYVIPTLGVYEKFVDIDFNKLPNEFVIKCTHDSGSIIICKDKRDFNVESSNRKISKLLKKNYYYAAREWPYKNVKPRIIIEKYINDNEEELNDYKLFCFNGKVKIILVCSERNKKEKMKETFFDENWNYLDLKEGGHPNDLNIKKPIHIEKMKKFAEILSKDIPFIRIDFYEVKGEVLFGELTFYPNAGFEKFEPEEYDRILGDMLKLPIESMREQNEK